MKNNPDKAATIEAMQVAAVKVAKATRIAEADARVARAARGRFKDAKKAWKLARKVAKRSAKRAKQAEEDLAALQKHIKRAGRQTPTQPKAKSAARKRGTKTPAKRSATRLATAPIEPASSTEPRSGETTIV